VLGFELNLVDQIELNRWHSEPMWLLGFGDGVEVLEPEEFAEIAENLLYLYQD